MSSSTCHLDLSLVMFMSERFSYCSIFGKEWRGSKTRCLVLPKAPVSGFWQTFGLSTFCTNTTKIYCQKKESIVETIGFEVFTRFHFLAPFLIRWFPNQGQLVFVVQSPVSIEQISCVIVNMLESMCRLLFEWCVCACLIMLCACKCVKRSVVETSVRSVWETQFSSPVWWFSVPHMLHLYLPAPEPSITHFPFMVDGS